MITIDIKVPNRMVGLGKSSARLSVPKNVNYPCFLLVVYCWLCSGWTDRLPIDVQIRQNIYSVIKLCT